MTFSIAARCPETGMFGVTVTSSSICVASRCAFGRAGVGAALSQNITDPDLGRRLLDLCEEGASAEEALAQVVTETQNVQWRQLGVVDTQGNTACFSGEHTLGVNSTAQGDGCVSMGNLLENDGVPQAMVDAFEKSNGHFAYRLLTALEAGADAGGEAGPVHSAGMKVYSEYAWPIIDLRVDWEPAADNAVPRLSRIWKVYEPQLEAYITRATDPAGSESYGVPGDE